MEHAATTAEHTVLSGNSGPETQPDSKGWEFTAELAGGFGCKQRAC
jgi:hypothetical protein